MAIQGLFVIFAAAATAAAQTTALTFAIPPTGNTFTVLDPAPVGLSFEFFMFPSYFVNVTATTKCLSNWQTLNSGTWPPIRIGGTSQDRASFDGSLTNAYVMYTVDDPKDAPDTLTFGRMFMQLAGTYAGSVVFGLGRAKDNLQNTIDAAKVVIQELGSELASGGTGKGNLLAIELGSEPEYWAKDGEPIADGRHGSWGPGTDAASQNDWVVNVEEALGLPDRLFQVGNHNEAPPTWSAAELLPVMSPTAKILVRTYSHHNYPGGSLHSLMTHANIVRNVAVLGDDATAAAAAGGDQWEYVLGETNSVSGSGGEDVSQTFGAALWTMDYALRASFLGIKRTYFHQGIVGNCLSCFWGRYSMGAPYYGATAALAVMAGARYITAVDAGTDNYAVYATYDGLGNALRVLLYNSDFFDGTGVTVATQMEFTLTGLTVPGDTVRAKRLTATSALSRQDRMEIPTFGAQSFADGTCEVVGAEQFETVAVANGQATFSVRSTEALVVYLQ